VNKRDKRFGLIAKIIMITKVSPRYFPKQSRFFKNAVPKTLGIGVYPAYFSVKNFQAIS
jgi:hypothetical protein